MHIKTRQTKIHVGLPVRTAFCAGGACMTEQEFVQQFREQNPTLNCRPGAIDLACAYKLDAFSDACEANAREQDKINGNEECIAGCSLGWRDVFHGTWL